MSTSDLWVLTEEGKQKIERVMKKLFREEHLSGDDMRNLAQVLEVVLRREIFELPDELQP